MHSVLEEFGVQLTWQGVHTDVVEEEVLIQTWLSSIAQVLLHPSPLIVFPSSQTSVEVVNPSPQIPLTTLKENGEDPARGVIT